METVKSKLALPGGGLEYAALAALWELHSATVREIHEQIGRAEKLAYTMTATVLDRLHDKGLVVRSRSGMASVYRPKLPRAVVEQARARAVVGRLLGSAPRAAVATLVDAVEAIDPNLLEELASAVAARRRSRVGA